MRDLNKLVDKYKKDNTTETNKFLGIDFLITESCSMRCHYCSENFNKKLVDVSEEQQEQLISRIESLLQNDRFYSVYNGFKIFFWGGEPTIRPKIIEKFVSHFKDNPRVCFFIYSNGFQIEKVVDILTKYQKIKCINGENKISLQISYDGKASHDVARVDIKGNGTANRVRENMFKLKAKDIEFHTHPTIDFNNLDKIALNYFEHKDLARLLKMNIRYAPTIDYQTDHRKTMTKEKLENYKSIITNEVRKIAESEIEYYRKNKEFSFSWITENRAVCGAGAGLNVLDLNGDMLVCHGALYTDPEAKKNLIINNLYLSEEEFLDKLINNNINFNKARMRFPEECKNCYATYCMKCNVAKFGKSDKEDYFDKWTDYPVQDYLCEIYRHCTKLRKALIKVAESRED